MATYRISRRFATVGEVGKGGMTMNATDSADVWSRPYDFRLDARVGAQHTEIKGRLRATFGKGPADLSHRHDDYLAQARGRLTPEASKPYLQELLTIPAKLEQTLQRDEDIEDLARLGASLDAIACYLEAKPYAYEVLVVDDGSTDSTADCWPWAWGWLMSTTCRRTVASWISSSVA